MRGWRCQSIDRAPPNWQARRKESVGEIPSSTSKAAEPLPRQSTLLLDSPLWTKDSAWSGYRVCFKVNLGFRTITSHLRFWALLFTFSYLSTPCSPGSLAPFFLFPFNLPTSFVFQQVKVVVQPWKVERKSKASLGTISFNSSRIKKKRNSRRVPMYQYRFLFLARPFFSSILSRNRLFLSLYELSEIRFHREQETKKWENTPSLGKSISSLLECPLLVI